MNKKYVFLLLFIPIFASCATNYVGDLSLSMLQEPVSIIDSRGINVSVEYLVDQGGSRKHGYLFKNDKGIYKQTGLAVLYIPIKKYLAKDVGDVKISELVLRFDSSELQKSPSIKATVIKLKFEDNGKEVIIDPIAGQARGGNISGNMRPMAITLFRNETIKYYYYAPANAIPVSVILDDGSEISLLSNS